VSVANLWLFGDRLPDIHKRRLGAAARTTRDDRLGGVKMGDTWQPTVVVTHFG
jgi:hypothetical protein